MSQSYSEQHYLLMIGVIITMKKLKSQFVTRIC
jgi:hypothetical protein